MNLKPLLFIVTLIASEASWADKIDSLEKTTLFTSITKDCEPVNLKTWKHPTKEVLSKYKLKLTQLQLCNNKSYPIFYAEFPYDPATKSTNSYFLPLETDMARKNGWNSYSIVDTSNKQMINIKVDKSTKTLEEHYDQYF